MGYQVTQDDLNILRQGEQEIYLKVELLNKNYKVIDSLEGNLINDGYTQDRESIQRRTYTCTLQVTNSSFTLGEDKKIWFDKRIRPYYGVKSLRTKEIIWYLLGTYAYSSVGYNYDSTTNQLSLTCPDLMALYDGTLNGELGGYGSSNTDSTIIATGLLIPAGEDIRASIIATLKEAGISNYVVEDIGKEIPYDLEFDTGVKYADVWTKIRDLYDSWEFFFDEYGTFIWRKIPTCLEDDVVLNDDIMQLVTKSESTTTSFSGIYNVTEVYGKVLELENDDRYADSSIYSNNVYHVTLDLYNSWEDIDHLTKIGVKICADNLANPSFSVNNYSPIPICDGDGVPLKAGVLEADHIYVFRFRRITVDGEGLKCALYLLGQYQCRGIYEETSDSCPFSIQKIGRIVRSLNYESLSDDAACYNQAEYLTYQTTAMMDTITLTVLVIPWLEVNQKIEYTSKLSGEKSQYIIKSLNWATGDGTMSLVLYKFLEDFSFVYNRKYKQGRRL